MATREQARGPRPFRVERCQDEHTHERGGRRMFSPSWDVVRLEDPAPPGESGHVVTVVANHDSRAAARADAAERNRVFRGPR